MLILSRRLNEKVFIEINGVLIEVMVTKIQGDKIRIGFTTPPEARIDREEIWYSKQADRRDDQ